MLVIKRGLEDSFKIGEDIEVKILGIDRNAVKLGITAPKAIPVIRHDAKVKIPKHG